MLTININLEYFLAALGTLVVLAYYANGRFTKLETNVERPKKAFEALACSRHAARKTRASQFLSKRTESFPTISFSTLASPRGQLVLGAGLRRRQM